MLNLFRKNKKRNLNFGYFKDRFLMVLGIVLVWRGIWYALDELDKILWGGGHFWTAILGIILGIIILFLPDGDLKEVEKI